jgi:hypothetical protein
MPSFHRLTSVLLLTACACALGAADKPATAPRAKPGGEEAGKADAKATFARQAGAAQRPTGAEPGFIGAYIWGGRADQNYKPFFQWELRLAGGSAAASGLRARVTTLGPTRQTLGQGDWKDWGSLDAGGQLDVDYRANCTNFAAYQLEVTWSGGKETFLAPDKGSVPVPLSAVADQGFVVAVGANFELDEKAKIATVTWTDWNLGGRPAHDVVQVLHLRDAANKEIKAITYRLKGEIAAGAVLAQNERITNAPAFATISVSTEMADESAGATIAFTGAKDIEIANIRADGAKLAARVRNGLDSDQDGVVVTITLQDKAGKALKAFEIPVGKLARGEERDIGTDLGGVTSWAGVETGWRGGGAVAQAPAAKPAARGTLPGAVTAAGLTFTPQEVEKTPTGLLLHGTLHNDSGKDLSPLRLSLTVSDAGKRSQELVWKTGELGAGADGMVVVACTLAEIGGVQMSWKTGAVE